MKKIIIISSAILVLGLGLVLKRQHHQFKKESFDYFLNIKYEYLPTAEENLKYSKNPIIPSSYDSELILNEERHIKDLKNSMKKEEEHSNISFISYVFNVVPKQLLNYFK
jgi:hypothetical protein